MRAERPAVLCLLCLFIGAARAEEVRFTKEPTVTVADGTVRIDFAVSRATDVTVGIEDTKDRIIRHLAAGVLGKNSPTPLTPNSLHQTLVWDGTDDRGKTVGPDLSRFKVRVNLGLQPTFGSFIGHQPADLGWVRGLAAGPDGKLYVFHVHGSTHPGDASATVSVLDRTGRYVRTISPYSAELPDGKLKGFKRITLPGGAKVPFIYQFETRSHVPGLGGLPSQRPVVTRDGRLAFVGIHEGPCGYAMPGEARLTVIGTDGSATVSPARTFVAPNSDTGACLALSPDEKTVYATGVRVGPHGSPPGHTEICKFCDGKHHGETWKCTRPTHAVYAFAWHDKKAKLFVGDPKTPADGHAQLNHPVSVAVDKAGNVYVADLGNNRISIFSPQARPLARIAVDQPQRVEVHRKTGAIYVLSGRQKLTLIKFDGYRTSREIARVALPPKRYHFYEVRRPLIALDDSVEPARVYLNSPFVCIEDQGRRFGEPRSLRPPALPDRPNSIASVMELSLDRQRGLLYVNNHWRYDLAGGRWKLIANPKGIKRWGRMWPGNSPYSSVGAAGLDGNYYVNIGVHGSRVYRFGPEMTLLPFARARGTPGTGDDAGRPIVGYARNRGRGLTADASGNVYVLWKKAPRDPGDYHRAQALYLYGPDGSLKREKLVNASIPSISSVRVDYAGNIYLAAGLRPGDSTLPPGLEGRLPAGRTDPDAVHGLNGYPLIYGSIIKFAPEGGEIRDGIGGTVCNYGHGRRIEAKGAKWIFPGASTVPSWSTPKRQPGTVTSCLCEAPCFDVDGFGRSFFADAGRCRVGVIDTNGNEICWFGGYGNMDSRGLSFCWPQAVAVGDDAAFVGGRLNRRIVRVKLTYAVERRCPVR